MYQGSSLERTNTIVPKQNSIFALAIPSYSTLSPSTSKWEPAQAYPKSSITAYGTG
ncbi:hypothetical protein BDN67DRAFT_1060593 [Paxillus ammoniavirescens]|nr:hypothetical protein BDN67DRAFT_1060593 [Paxillus ammoniavirescens]